MDTSCPVPGPTWLSCPLFLSLASHPSYIPVIWASLYDPVSYLCFPCSWVIHHAFFHRGSQQHLSSTQGWGSPTRDWGVRHSKNPRNSSREVIECFNHPQLWNSSGNFLLAMAVLFGESWWILKIVLKNQGLASTHTVGKKKHGQLALTCHQAEHIPRPPAGDWAKSSSEVLRVCPDCSLIPRHIESVVNQFLFLGHCVQ